MGIDILGVDILGIDILGIDILAPTPPNLPKNQKVGETGIHLLRYLYLLSEPVIC